jgi:L-fucose isomerase-like protein
LKPGRVTIARVSQSSNQHRMVIGGGDMVRAPLAFSGTAGVVHFDRPVDAVMSTVMGEGLEHHFGIVYGDVRDELRALAKLLSIDTVEI